jgi:ubiquinone/menaquinone biosynthesis C-methylase UbiE
MKANAPFFHVRLRSGLRQLATAWLLCLSATAALAQGSAAPYVPTPWPILDEMLKLAQIKKGEYIIDLGSGDGRLVIEAAKRYGAQGHGIDIQDKLVKLATEGAANAGVSDRVKFIVGDLFVTDLSKADVVTVYLLPSIMDKLVPKLQKELRPGTRIVSHDYALEGMQHDKMLEFHFQEKVEITGTTRTLLYHYVVPPRQGAKPAAATQPAAK